MKKYICNCVNPTISIEGLVEIIENGKKISKKDFKNNCIIYKSFSKAIEDNYTEFYKYKSVYYFVHSGIEYIFANDNSKSLF